MSNILIDTDILIDFLRRPDKEKSIFSQTFLSGEHQAAIALVTVLELWAGKSTANKATESFLNELILRCNVIQPTLEIAKLAGVLIRQSNYKLKYQDAEIAASAIQQKLPLLTFNTKDYQSIANLSLWK